MRRAIVALVGTAAGTVLLVGAKAGFSSPADADTKPLANRAPGYPADQPLPPGADPSPTAPGAAPTAGNGQPPATTAPANSGRTTAPPANRPTTSAPRPPSTTMRDGTFNGDGIYTDYGNVEVSITVSGGKIQSVKMLDKPGDTPRSRELSARVETTMGARAKSANSANIDGVSGATYTSDGYKQSLQSAIDRARGA